MALVCACTRYVFPSLFIRQTQSSLAKMHTITKFNNSKILLTKLKITETTQQKRTYFWIFKRRTNNELRLVDKPPENSELVYRCTMDNMFYAFQHLGFYTAVLLCLGLLIKSGNKEHFRVEEQEEDSEPKRNSAGEIALSMENQEHIMLGIFFFTYCSVLWFTTRIPVRIYYHPGSRKYLMYVHKVVPTKVNVVQVRPGELMEKTGVTFNLWKYDMYEHKKSRRNLLLLEEYFKYPGDLYVMLGQQPERDEFEHFQGRESK